MTEVHEQSMMENETLDWYTDVEVSENLDSEINDLYSTVIKTTKYSDSNEDKTALKQSVTFEESVYNNNELDDDGPVNHYNDLNYDDGQSDGKNDDPSNGHYDIMYNEDERNHYNEVEAEDSDNDVAEEIGNEKIHSQPEYYSTPASASAADSDAEDSDKHQIYNDNVSQHSVQLEAVEDDLVYEDVQEMKKPPQEPAKEPQSSAANTADSKKKQQQTSASSGKFVLRTIRNADALHYIRQKRSSSSDNNPELDELETVIRSTNRKSTSGDAKNGESKNGEQLSPGQKEKMASLIATHLITKFEKAIASETRVDETDETEEPDETDDAFEGTNQPYATTVIVHTVTPTSPTSSPIVNSTAKAKSPPAAAAASSTEKSQPTSPTSPVSPNSVSQTQKPTYGTQTSNSGKQNSRVNGEPGQQETTSSVPAWKTEIESRKKTKAYVHSQKPKEPMKMFEVPEWKKQLQEKQKYKKQTSTDESDNSTSKVLNPSAVNQSVKMEIELIRRQMSSNSEVEGDAELDLPEWARLADEKKKQTLQKEINGN